MRLFKKIIFALLILVGIALILSFFFVKHLNNRSLPDYEKDLFISGLKENVTVYRDTFGIPHIFANNEHDLYLTTGYIMAQERLWQMDLLRRVTTGKLSEIFGKDFLDTDVLLRALDYPAKSAWVLDSCSQDILTILDNFSRGINIYIAENYKNLPPEFTILGYKPDPWEPIHSVNLIGYMAWDLESGWSPFVLQKIKPLIDSIRWKQLLPDIPSRKSVVYPEYNAEQIALETLLNQANGQLNKLHADVFSGSNNWAVDGSKTQSGEPILANDMHLGLNLPGIWMQIHQHVVPGGLNVTGVAVPGQPFVICGHNDSIAWGMTNAFVDNVDFYEEKISDDSSKYLYQGQWYDIEKRNEIIKTKEGEEIEKVIRFTHRGPIVNRFKEYNQKTISMHWVGQEFSNEMRTVFLLNRASNWDEFKHALRTFKSISQNINYADTKGNIGLFYAAGIPIRKRTAGYEILPGWTAEYDWEGFVPFDELPFSFNPGSGYVASANNKTIGNDYPYHIGSWYSMPYRMDRIVELLEGNSGFTPESMKLIQTDVVSKKAQTHTDEILSILSANQSKLNETDIAALNILKHWDFNMQSSSVAATLFEFFYINLTEEVFADEMGDTLFESYLRVSKLPKVALYNIWNVPNSPWWDNVLTSQTENMDSIVVNSFIKTVRNLSDSTNSGIEKWNWGRFHTLTLQHPLGSVNALDQVFNLNRGPFEAGGSYHTVMPYSYPFNKPFLADHGASQRHIYDLSDWDNSWTVIPTGISGIPKSRFYGNQTELYINNKYHRDLFSKESIVANALFVQNYIPE